MDEFTLAGNSTRFSFLTVSLSGTREKKIKSSCLAFAKVLFSNSLYYTLRTFNVNYLLHI